MVLRGVALSVAELSSQQQQHRHLQLLRSLVQSGAWMKERRLGTVALVRRLLVGVVVVAAG